MEQFGEKRESADAGGAAAAEESVKKRARRYRALFFLLLAALILFLRLPSLSDRFCNPDPGENAYSAMLLLDGRCPYSDAIMPLPPGTVFLYAAFFALFGYQMLSIHLFACLWTLATAYVMYRFGRRYTTEASGLIAAGLYALYQADSMSAGICANYEFWTMLPALSCLYLVNHSRADAKSLIGAGLLASIGVMMKQPASVFAVATAFLVAAYGLTEKEHPVRVTAQRLAWLALGVAICIGALFIYMSAHQCLASMLVELNPAKLKGYIISFESESRWNWAVHNLRLFASSNSALLLFLSAAILPWVSGYSIPRKFAAAVKGVAVFLVASLGSLAAGGHYYDHYFIVVIPFLVMAVALFAGLACLVVTPRLRCLLLLLLFGSAVFNLRNEIMLATLSAKSLIQNGDVLSEEIFDRNRRRRLGTGQEDQTLNNLEWQDLYKQVSEYIKQNASPGDTIWCYEYAPEIYIFSGRLAPTRHQEHFEIITSMEQQNYGLWFKEVDETVKNNRRNLIGDLEAAPPRFIILFSHSCSGKVARNLRIPREWPKNAYGSPTVLCKPKTELFPELSEFIQAHYKRKEPPLNNALDLYERVMIQK